MKLSSVGFNLTKLHGIVLHYLERVIVSASSGYKSLQLVRVTVTMNEAQFVFVNSFSCLDI